ncbi:MAG: GNAT family N-acetyltransferase [Clostridia bacterium]|nr:GNAT family N-acetyltransferase [Clostridia bacterium]
MNKNGCVFRRLAEMEAPQMFDLIVQRIRWMDEKGIRQWNVTGYDTAYPLESKKEACRKGQAFGLVDAEGRILCAAILLEEDEYWPRDGVNALYVHSLASRSDCPGAGAAFLRAAENYAREMGKEYLRLDSQTNNEKLSRYYIEQGFREAGACVDGPYSGTLRQKKL